MPTSLSDSIDVDVIATAHAIAFARQVADQRPDIAIHTGRLEGMFARHLSATLDDIDPDGIRFVASTATEAVAAQLELAITAYARRTWDHIVQDGTYDPSAAAAVHTDRMAAAAARAERSNRWITAGLVSFLVWGVTLGIAIALARYQANDLADSVAKVLLPLPFVAFFVGGFGRIAYDVSCLVRDVRAAR